MALLPSHQLLRGGEEKGSAGWTPALRGGFALGRLAFAGCRAQVEAPRSAQLAARKMEGPGRGSCNRSRSDGAASLARSLQKQRRCCWTFFRELGVGGGGVRSQRWKLPMQAWLSSGAIWLPRIPPGDTKHSCMEIWVIQQIHPQPPPRVSKPFPALLGAPWG